MFLMKVFNEFVKRKKNEIISWFIDQSEDLQSFSLIMLVCLIMMTVTIIFTLISGQIVYWILNGNIPWWFLNKDIQQLINSGQFLSAKFEIGIFIDLIIISLIVLSGLFGYIIKRTIDFFVWIISNFIDAWEYVKEIERS